MKKRDLEERLHEAIRANRELEKNTLRLALTAIKLAEVEKGDELDPEEVIGVLQREAKARRETIADARKAKRDELADRAQAELAYLEAFLPEQLGDNEIEAMVREVIGSTGSASLESMGLVMQSLMPALKDRADGKRVSEIVRRLLSEN